MDGSEAADPTTGRADRWSKSVFVMSSMLCVLLLLWAFFDDEWAEPALIMDALEVLLLIFGPCFLAYCSVAAVVFLFTKLPRKAVSHLLTVSALVLTIFGARAVAVASGELRFRSHVPHYEELIAKERAKSSGSKPIRLVLEFRNASPTVTTTDLRYLVYDETDEVLKDPCTALQRARCPVQSPGVADSEYGIFSVERIEGHFYRITES